MDLFHENKLHHCHYWRSNINDKDFINTFVDEVYRYRKSIKNLVLKTNPKPYDFEIFAVKQ